MKRKTILLLASLSLLTFLPKVAQADDMSLTIQEQEQKIEVLTKKIKTNTEQQATAKKDIETFETREITLDKELTTLNDEEKEAKEAIKTQEVRLEMLEELASLHKISPVLMVKNNSVSNQKERIEKLEAEVLAIQTKKEETLNIIEAEAKEKETTQEKQQELSESAKKLQAEMTEEKAVADQLKAAEEAAKEAAARLEKTGFLSPLTRDYSISSGFGYRVDPTGYSGNGHDGIDITGTAGEAILVARYGTVVEAGYHYSAGNYAIVKHDNGYYTYYMHMTENFVSVGQILETSQQIGTMGTTGYSTGVHLHFGIATGVWSGFVDPTSFI